MGLPKEPRQKMINLMYLVLTALLALNVSAEILNAFKTINESIDKSNASITKKNSVVYAQIQRRLKDKPSIKPIADKAVALNQESEDAYTYIDNLKLDILKAAKYDPKTGEYNFSDIDVAARILVKEGRGKDLYQKLADYKQQVVSLIDTEDTAAIMQKLALDLSFEKDPGATSAAKNTWEYKYFNMTPVVASVAILNKFQNDVKNTEAAVLEYLFNKIGEDVIIYDKLEPFVSANTQYVLLGQQYEAQIGIGAISTSIKPTIKVNGRQILVHKGMGIYREKPTAVGSRRLNIEITHKKADGSFETTKKVVNYTIGSSAGVTVSADKMNLFYIGIENPVTIVGQVGDEKMKVAMEPQGQIKRKAPGKYGVSVTTPGECFVTVQEAGKPNVRFPFRVKSIPDPTLKVGSLKPGSVRKAKFRSQTGVIAILEDFEFDAYFTVESYNIILSGAGFPDIFQAKVRGGSFNRSVNRALKKIRKGTIVTLIDVYVKGPSKKTRRLSSVSYQIK